MTVCAVLAGGAARRMGGGDKCLQLLGGKPILGHVIERVAPQAGTLVLNANGDASRFAPWNLPVIPDHAEGRGPLAGLLAAMDWAKTHHPQARDILSVPADTPFLPLDLFSRLTAARGESAVAIAASGGQGHWVVGLWSVTLAGDIRRALSAPPRVEEFVRAHSFTLVNFDVTPVDPFLNINRPADLESAERLLRA